MKLLLGIEIVINCKTLYAARFCKVEHLTLIACSYKNNHCNQQFHGAQIFPLSHLRCISTFCRSYLFFSISLLELHTCWKSRRGLNVRWFWQICGVEFARNIVKCVTLLCYFHFVAILSYCYTFVITIKKKLLWFSKLNDGLSYSRIYSENPR